jgi:hypothetical protein
MFLKNITVLGLSVAIVAASAVAFSAEYRPDDFLTLDLSKAVLSPTPLGPASRFAPVPVKAKSDPAGDVKTDGKLEANTHVSRARPLRERFAVHEKPRREVQLLAERRRGAARVRLTQRHSDPLDARAQVMSRRVQVWPCKSGGICNWKQ